MNEQQRVFLVDDDAVVRDSIGLLLEAAGFTVHSYASARQFLADTTAKVGCLIADVRMPDMSGLELQQELVARQIDLPVIIITGHGEVPLAVRAMKAGAIDFIEKPFEESSLLDSLRRALEAGSRNRSRTEEVRTAQKMLELLTPRERAVLDRLVKGRSNKVAAFELGISPRTIEIHRAHIMDKLKAANLSDLVRIALAAGLDSASG